jgi:hypothetical protein
MLASMIIGFGPSLLDGELALITWLARRGLQRQPAPTAAKRRARRELTVLPEDAVWPTLANYPYDSSR